MGRGVLLTINVVIADVCNNVGDNEDDHNDNGDDCLDDGFDYFLGDFHDDGDYLIVILMMV